jgi:hypothetical protein
MPHKTEHQVKQDLYGPIKKFPGHSTQSLSLHLRRPFRRRIFPTSPPRDLQNSPWMLNAGILTDLTSSSGCGFPDLFSAQVRWGGDFAAPKGGKKFIFWDPSEQRPYRSDPPNRIKLALPDEHLRDESAKTELSVKWCRRLRYVSGIQ